MCPHLLDKPRLSLICLILLLLSGCSPPQSHPGILIVAKPGDAVKLDPADITDSQSAQITENLFDTLVEYQDGNTAIEPALADSWHPSADGKTWTFHLRPHVHFHDGTLLDADAVVFNFQRQMDPRNPFHDFGKFIYWQTLWGGFPGIVSKVEAINRQTVQFKLSRPLAPFLANLAMFPFAISSPTAIRRWGQDYFKHPVGTGPFRFVLWEERERVVLDVNPHYWRKISKIKRLIFQPITDNTSRKLQLERGTVDLITGVNPEDVDEIRHHRDLSILEDPGMNVSYLAMNCEKPPFNQPIVREAIRHSINKKKLVKALYQGHAQLAINPIPPMLQGYVKGLRDFEYDPEKSRTLLRNAGFPHGLSTTLWYLPISRDYMPQPKAIAEAIQADLENVGIHVKLVTFDWGTYLAKTQEGEHDMALLGWVGDNGDPDNFLYALLDKDNAVKPAQNISFYKNETVHHLLREAQSCINPIERTKLYQQAIQQINQDSPWVPIAYANQIIALKKNIDGFQLHPTSMLRFREVVIK